MFARVTLFEIDTLRISLDSALERFRQTVAPEMRRQAGYKGAYLLRTREGRGLLMTLWASEEAAMAGIESGYYAKQLSAFASLFRAPPGRDHYEVVFAESPGAAGP